MNYCKFCSQLPLDNIHRKYHDNHYGFPIYNDFELFGRLILEINQAGLSWETILKKEDNFRNAFDGYNYFIIAAYNFDKIDLLIKDTGIIRHRQKIESIVYNAIKLTEINETHGSFGDWLNSHDVKSLEDWVKIFKKNFKFVGKEIVNEFLMSIGILEGAHQKDCPIQLKINLLNK
jgi:DNA-3-methyladenine glycosylase I